MLSRHWGALAGLIAITSLGVVAGCGGDDPAPTSSTPTGTGGAAGTGGSAGSGGSAAGTGGSSAGTGGSSTTGGSGGTSAGAGGSDAGAGGSDPAGTCTTAETCADFKTDPTKAAVPPAAPADGTPAASTDLIHGISKLYVGETDRDGTPNADAWKKIGFDIDGWNSTPKQGFHCKPQAGGKPADIRTDGDNGIDNSFGKNIVGDILGALIENPSEQISSSIDEGGFSIVMKFEKLGETSAASSVTGVNTQLFAAAGTVDPADASKKVAPGADWSNYEWHPFSEIVNPDGSSKVKFAGSYTNKGVWVSGSKGTVSLSLNIQGVDLKLDINQAQIAVDLSDPKAGTNGTIGGVLATTELVKALQNVAANFGTQFCDPNSSALQSILDSVRQSSDIMADGSQDPEKECDAISIGLGFDTKVTKIGDAAPPAEPSNNCPPM